MRRAIWATALVVLAAACGGETVPMPPATTSGTSPFKTPSTSPDSPSSGTSVEPVDVPEGTAASYANHVDAAADGVLEIHVVIGDATGDGSPDALTFEDTGGSGACGTWRVLDLMANAGVFERTTCDTVVEPSTDPVGLLVRKAIFQEGDAHCCPSSIRVSLLTLDPAAGWTVSSTHEEPA